MVKPLRSLHNDDLWIAPFGELFCWREHMHTTRKGQDKSMLLKELAKNFGESCRKIAKLRKIYTALALGKITLEDFEEAHRLILEEQSG